MPQVTWTKPSLPTIWLDTSVFIKFTKITRGEGVSPEEQESYGRLLQVLGEKVNKGELLCPEGDQREEFEGRRLDKEVLQTLAELSLGNRFTHRVGIFDCQVQRGMHAYIKREDEIPIPLTCFFHRDPVEVLKERLNQKFVITLNLRTPDEILQHADNAKRMIVEEVEKIRQTNRMQGKTFAQQLQEEERAYLDTYELMYGRFIQKSAGLSATLHDFFGISGYLAMLAIWKRWGGDPPSREGLRRFLNSDHFFELPIVAIKSRLNAELVTGDQAIEPGDSMDVEMLSAVIPACHYLVTDRKMEARIRKLGIDQEFDARVYSIRSAEELINSLTSLAGADLLRSARLSTHD